MLKKGHKTNFVSNTVIVVGSISLAIFSFFTIHGFILPPALASAEPSYATSSEVGINVKESIKIAVDKDHLALVDGEGSTQIAPSASGTLVTGDVNVAVTTNAYGGYRLGVYTSDPTTDMKHNNTSVNTAVSSISGASGYDATTGMSSLSPNTWGFRKYTEASNVGGNEIPASWSNWYGVGNNSTNMAIIDIKDIGEGPSTYCNDLSQPVAESGCSSSSYDTYKVGFGANLTSSLPAGIYTNNIIFSALTNEASTFLAFNANAPSGTTVSGSMAPKSILKGSTVTLPNTTTFKRDGFGIKGWALTEGATTVASITQPDPSNPGSTVAVQLTPGATVDVDSLISATGIPSSTTGPIPLYAVWDNAYTINYIANNPEGTTVTGTMDPSNAILGLNTTIPSASYEIDNYTLKGWAFTNNAEDPASISEAGAKDLISGATFTTQQLITAAQTAGQSVSTSTAGTITLYAVWEQDGYGEDTMQGWTGCANLAPNASVMLTDARDNKEYAVKKLPDGKCWMMQNLTINGVELTPEDTNIADGNTYYLPKDGGAGSLTSSSTKDATTGYNFANGSDNQAMFKFRSKDTSVTNDSDTGYYNFYTATLGYSYSNDGKTSGTSPQDICPKGWRMPRTTDSGTNVTAIDTTNDFTYLARTYSTSGWSGSAIGTNGYGYYSSNSTLRTSINLGAASPLATATANNYAGFSYAGFWYGTNATANSVGSYGYYWSASIYDTSYGYFLNIDSSGVYPQSNLYKYYGRAVRCINDYKDGYMQDFDTSTLTNIGQTAKLKDARDGKIYTVKKLQDGKVWMIQNLTIAGAALDNIDTNIPVSDTATYYLPPQNTRYASAGNLNNSAVKSASSSVNFGSNYSNYLQVGYRAKNDTSNSNGAAQPEDTAFYNFYTATLGYSYYNDGKASGSSPRDICPKGWRLPWTNDSGGSIRTTTAEFYILADSFNPNAAWTNKPTGSTTTDAITEDSIILSNMIKEAENSSTVAGAAGFTYSGEYRSTGLEQVGNYGRYWSSSIAKAVHSYDLLTMSSGFVYPQGTNEKNDGYAIRCIAGTRS